MDPQEGQHHSIEEVEAALRALSDSYLLRLRRWAAWKLADILPNYLFTPACARRPLTVETALSLSGEFRASITACAIRLIQRGSFPGMVICYSREKREWFVPNEGLPEKFFPLQELHQDTNAFELLYTDGWGKTPIVESSGTLWINRRDASKILVDSVRIEAQVKAIRRRPGVPHSNPLQF